MNGSTIFSFIINHCNHYLDPHPSKYFSNLKNLNKRHVLQGIQDIFLTNKNRN